MAKPTIAELQEQLTEMTKRATRAEGSVDNLKTKLEEVDALAIAKSSECGQLRQQVGALTKELRSTKASLAAYKGSATKAQGTIAVLKKHLSPQPRPIGAPRPARSEEEAAARASALELALAAGTAEIVFSDGRREIRELAPLIVTGDAWRDTPQGRVLNAEVDLEPGDCARETMELCGFGLLNEAGDQVGYCPLPDMIRISRNQHVRLSHNTIRF
jgi:hypothetical protein